MRKRELCESSVFITVGVKCTGFWDVMPCSLVEVYPPFLRNIWVKEAEHGKVIWVWAGAEALHELVGSRSGVN
jgi:hypothetical protein